MKYMDEVFYNCKKYMRCSINNCPLGSDFPYYIHEDDRDKKCKLTVEEIDNIKLRISNESQKKK